MLSITLLLTWVGAAIVVKGQVTGGGQKFVRCKTLGSERCFEVELDEVVVTTGSRGTDDDVNMKFCSDVDASQCCTTPALDSAFSDDWSKNDVETWGKSYFGPCRGFKFLIRLGLNVTVTKAGLGALDVRNIDVYTLSTAAGVSEAERFQCDGFTLGGSQRSTNINLQCKTGPYKYMEIRDLNVTMGANGTNDDIKATICSDSNSVCCETELDRLLRNDWKANREEPWDKADFGECGKILYKVTNSPVLSMTKNGRKPLVVKSADFGFTSRADPKAVTKFLCGGFTLADDCTRPPICKHVFSSCTKVDLVSSVRTVSPTPQPVAAATTTKKKGLFGIFG